MPVSTAGMMAEAEDGHRTAFRFPHDRVTFGIITNVRFSRHAANSARRMKATIHDVERIVSEPEQTDIDERGNMRYIGYIHGERVRVVIAQDDPDLVISFHPRRN